MTEIEGNTPESRRKIIENVDVWVVKVGSRVLTGTDGRLDRDHIERLAKQLLAVAASGKKVVLVSSGAVASGVGRLGLPGRPKDLATLQAVAAVGQAHLIQVYEQVFTQHGKHAAQVLLTASDLDDRQRYLNVRNTLHSLLELETIPVINENDTVAVDELKTTFGDNDRLAAMVAGLFAKPMLVILSDVRGLYNTDPSDPHAKVIHSVPIVDASIEELVRDKKTGISKGGMASKLSAARFVTNSGQPVMIAWGREEQVLPRLLQGEVIGTMFLPQSKSLNPKKRWIGFTAQCEGKIVVDKGAVQAVCGQGRSLLAIGIRDVQGSFEKGDAVAIIDQDDQEIARGLTNYSASEVRQIRGCRSDRIQEILGECPYEEVIHRDNIALR
uniref:Glutamate 5-kinase n=1 Tax=uncultured bacterium A1Q1_fos_1815 TaxID=1256553 RepID=L7VVA0_9BACT|nr:glutamate 5-kinase [uncultured bacterium A1Q1_fos_1815]